MAQLQSALGGGAPLNLILNYRIPDTNINVQYVYKQGKTNVQFTCVPDDQVRRPTATPHHQGLAELCCIGNMTAPLPPRSSRRAASC